MKNLWQCNMQVFLFVHQFIHASPKNSNGLLHRKSLGSIPKFLSNAMIVAFGSARVEAIEEKWT
jgi:hypothetical protein